ncbi:Metallo-dependent phosphatase-like protein [Aspergillus similis]
MPGLDALLQRPEHESFWSRFCRSPMKSVAQYVHGQRSAALRKKTDNPVHVVCISDTHNTKPSLPDGDILIHAGDLTQSGTREELQKQIDWLDSQPHRYKIVIAGNHETFLDRNHRSYHGNEKVTIDWKSLIYLERTSTTLNLSAGHRLKVFGSPYTPKHGNGAFQYPRTDTTIWQEIPKDTDLLVTHGPPKAHLDLGHLGCRVLRQTLWEMEPRPLLHVFGHIHGGYGKEVVYWDPCQRAYEAIMDGESRWWSLCVLLYSWIRTLLFERTAADQATVMVNAAAIGGLRDEKRREAICVDI